MKNILLSLIFICCQTYIFGQEYDLAWAQTLMEPVGNDMEIIETSDGYYMFTGTAYNGTADIVVSKVDRFGNSQWAEYYGSSLSDESGNAIIEVLNNNYLVIGSKQSDLWILKVNSNGDTLWTKTIGETGITEKGMDITEYHENSFIITGSKFDPGDGNGSELWLVKIDSLGNLIWKKSYGTPAGSDIGVVVQTANDGSIIIGGTKFNPDNASWQEAWIIKTDANGDSLWSRKFLDSSFDVGSPVIITESDEIILLYNNYYPGHGDVALIKLNTNGDNIWSKYIYNQYSGYSLALNDNRLLFGGRANSSGFLFIADSLGDSLWSDIYTELYSCYSLINSFDDSIILLGTKDGFFTLVKLISTDLDINFNADKITGPLPLTCHFTDSSSIYVDNWQWDFENDGVIDSYEQYPTNTYFNEDSFSVKLVVSNGFLTDTLIKENYITTYFDTIANLYSIQDIPDDQGSWVKVKFARSAYDTDSLIFLKASSAELYTVEIDDGTGWTAAASTSAYGMPLYSVLVPTTKDSTSESKGLINFRVIAGMEEGNYVSQICSGYSVDNLKPSVPTGLFASLVSESKVKLKWLPNSETDFRFYTIYKNNNSQFESILQTIDTVFADLDVQIGKSYSYAIAATDHSGNESKLSEWVDIIVTGLEENSKIPNKYYLAQNYPNPFNPVTTIKYGLKKSGNVAITIFDVLGNKIKEIVNSYQNAGHHQISWPGENTKNEKVSSGVFFYQIITDEFKQNKKMLFIK